MNPGYRYNRSSNRTHKGMPNVAEMHAIGSKVTHDAAFMS